jgi:hypothetical protein
MARSAPYSKWLGTAFAALPDIGETAAALHDAVDARDPDRRQAALCTAYEAAGRWQNRLGIADPVDATRRPFFDRPYEVIDAARFATALLGHIGDSALAARPPIGGIDQFIDSTDVAARPEMTRTITAATHREPDRTRP